MSIRLSTEPATIVAGEPFELRVDATDPDSVILSRDCYTQLSFGDGSPAGCSYTFACKEAHGEWDPPTREGGSFRSAESHTFAQPGEYVITIAIGRPGCIYEPYLSEGNASIEVVANPPSG